MKIFQTVLFFLAAALLLPQTASAQNCRPGTYYNPGSYGIAAGCSSCYAGCKECSGGSPGECTVCMEGTFMIRSPAPSNNWNCAGCSTLFPISGGQCTKCTQSSCTEVTCNTGYRKSGTSCVKITCATGQYLSGNTCYTCPPFCSSCTGATNCTSCESGYTLSNGRCIEGSDEPDVIATCPARMTLSSDGKCCINK